ncbi:hypothetical protein Tco_0927351, partial [Tanacetum coccineum]
TTVTSLEAEQGSANIDKTPTMPYDSPLQRFNTLGSDEGSMTPHELMLIKKVKKLENKVKSSQARRRARIIVSDDEDDLEDPSKQGRKIAEIDQDPAISLVQHDVEIQGRHEHDMEFDFDLDAAKDVSTAEKDVSTAKPVSTAGAAVTTASVAAVSTASPTRRVSTADDITMAETLVYIRKSATKDKGKGKMDESEPVQTKTKLQQEQERLGYEAAVRLQAKLEEEERQRIARVHEAASSFNVEEWEDIQARVEADEELAQRLQAEEREMYTDLRGYSFDEIKNLFETTIRRVHTFVPIESEIEKVILELAAGSSKRDAEEELGQESSKRQKTSESSEPAEEPKDKEEELSQEELQKMMIIVPEQGINVEALQTKYLINNWEIYIEGTRKYWKIIRVGNHTEVHQFFDDMLKALDMDDLVMLWSLVKERFNSTEPKDDKEREIWLYDSHGVHHVTTEKGIDIYMLIEKEYPLLRGTLTQMLVAKLLVEQDNEMSIELLRKIFMQAKRPRR